jgi:hypothetical protein
MAAVLTHVDWRESRDLTVSHNDFNAIAALLEEAEICPQPLSDKYNGR